MNTQVQAHLLHVGGLKRLLDFQGQCRHDLLRAVVAGDERAAYVASVKLWAVATDQMNILLIGGGATEGMTDALAEYTAWRDSGGNDAA